MAAAAQSRPAEAEVEALLERTGTVAAWRFAASAHAGQLVTAGQAPYIAHPERVALLVDGDRGDPAMVAAALLHDVLEDSPAEPAQLAREFGDDVAALVVALSEDRSIPDYTERKDALREQVRRCGDRAALIYAADKLANARDLRQAYRQLGQASVEEDLGIPLGLRLELWRRDEAMCRRLLGPREPVTALAGELDGLEREGGGRTRI